MITDALRGIKSIRSEDPFSMRLHEKKLSKRSIATSSLIQADSSQKYRLEALDSHKQQGVIYDFFNNASLEKSSSYCSGSSLKDLR